MVMGGPSSVSWQANCVSMAASVQACTVTVQVPGLGRVRADGKRRLTRCPLAERSDPEAAWQVRARLQVRAFWKMRRQPRKSLAEVAKSSRTETLVMLKVERAGRVHHGFGLRQGFRIGRGRFRDRQASQDVRGEVDQAGVDPAGAAVVPDVQPVALRIAGEHRQLGVDVDPEDGIMVHGGAGADRGRGGQDADAHRLGRGDAGRFTPTNRKRIHA